MDKDLLFVENIKKAKMLPLNYKGISDLNKDILNNLHKFPHEIDLIVGIPRSGMLPANILALYLQKPYTDIDSFIEGRVYGSGERGKHFNISQVRNVLVIDDSISSGNAMNKARQKLNDMEGYNISYGAIYATEYGKKLVDCYVDIVEQPRAFEWNIFNHPFLIPNSCFDIDGVLCEDPPIDDDGIVYTEYLKNAIPKITPHVTIDTIVSCRLEKYRKITEEWLNKNQIKYKNLVMLPFNSKKERIEWGKHASYKAKVYSMTNNLIFFESSLEQAKEIAQLSGKLVFCTENWKLINKNLERVKKKHEIFVSIKKHIPKFLKKIIKNQK